MNNKSQEKTTLYTGVPLTTRDKVAFLAGCVALLIGVLAVSFIASLLLADSMLNESIRW